MKITKFYLRNFRNIKEQEFVFDENMNIFCGNNAQGKTNLCEAISLCMGPSFRGSRPGAFVPFNDDKPDIKIKMWFTTNYNTESENLIEYTFSNNKKELLYNGFPLKSAMELYGVLKYVVFIPEHLNLIKGKPDLRRDYLDSVAMMQTPVHLKKLSRYNKALKNKNNILYDITPYTDLSLIRPQLDSWNEVLAGEGLNVTYGRLKYFSQLEVIAAELYEGLSGGEKLGLKYYSSIFDRDDLKPEEINGLYDAYLKRLTDSFNSELKHKYTTLGVHHDDMIFTINGNNAREYASQGQKRSTALVLKLAEAEIIRSKSETPIMILDDVLSELDEKRKDFILNHIVNSQVFITCCNISDVQKLGKGKIWNVENGKFEEIN
ncbi:MAG: DNA replication and repair protein RecF [Eubacterium sp.]|nr:DNA replication and repair protein RecF [Eubacterium sp.]